MELNGHSRALKRVATLGHPLDSTFDIVFLNNPMKKFLVVGFVLLLSTVGFFYFYGREIAVSFLLQWFEKKTGLQAELQDVEVNWPERTIRIIAPKVFSRSDTEGDVITATTLLFRFDTSRLFENELVLAELLADHLAIISPSEEGALFRIIETFVDDEPKKNDGFKVSVGTIHGRNFERSRFTFGPATISLQPTELEIDIAPEEPVLTGRSPVEVWLQVPNALRKLSAYQGSVEVSGEVVRPNVSADLKLKESELLELKGELQRGILKIMPIAHSESSKVSGEITVRDLKLQAKDFIFEGLPLGLISDRLTKANSRLSLQGSVNLLNFAGAMTGNLSLSNLSELPGKLSAVAFDLAVDRQEFRISQGVAVGEVGEISYEGAWKILTGEITGKALTKGLLLKQPDLSVRVPRGVQLSSQLEFSGNLDELTLAGPVETELFKFETNKGKTTEVKIRADVDLTIPPKRPLASSGQVVIPPLRIESQEREITTAQPVSLTVKEGRIILPNTEVSVGDQSLTIEGSISPLGYDLKAKGGASIASLVGHPRGIDDLKGDLELQIQLAGPLKAPQLYGSVDVQNGGLTVPIGSGEIFHIDDISGRAIFDDKKLTLQSLKNGSGDGILVMIGEIDNFLTAKRTGSLALSIDQVQLQPDPNVNIRLHADSQLTFSGDEVPRFRAAITIDEALYEQRSNLGTLVKKLISFIEAGPAKEGSAQKKIVLPLAGEINVVADRSLILDTDILQAEVSADLKLTSDAGGVFIDGALSGDSGELQFGRNLFDISILSVRFSNQHLGTLPSVELKAEGELGQRGQEELVQLDVSGILPTPAIRLRSETGRPERELLAQLGLAVDRVAITERGDAERASLLSALNPFSKAGIQERVSGLTSGATVEVESGYSADTGTFSPRLLLQQELPFNFTLVGQSELSQFNRSQVNLEYPLTEQTNLFTGWKNAPTTQNPESLSGSFGLGMHYRERFPGTEVVPFNLIWENVEDFLHMHSGAHR